MKPIKATRAEVEETLSSRQYWDLLPNYKHDQRRGRKKAPSEASDGAAVHLQLISWGLLHTHTANERIDGRSYKHAIAQGMRSGWPDFTVFDKGGRVLFVELKRERWASWSVSQNQLDVITELRAVGHMAEICWGATHAIALIDAWRRLPKQKHQELFT